MQKLKKCIQFLEDYKNKKKETYNITLTYEEIQALMEGSYSDVEEVIDNILDQYQKQAESKYKGEGD
jgi:hypothetical protein